MGSPSRLAFLLVGLWASSALGIDLERLVMPDEVTAAHAEFESDCGSCHQRFDRAAQTRLCLDCHEKVAADRDALRGFHGKASTAKGAACTVCHTEHQGRDGDIVGLDRAAFDHRFTDFALEGSHAGVACVACHPNDVAFRDAPSSCVDCHVEVEPHGGELGSACGDCHDAVAWRHVRFDHAGTGFPLVGRHADARCGACHPAERWKETPDDCVSCHRSEDAHRGSFGLDCGTCHEPVGWKGQGFDHGRDTRFALSGAHQRVACEGCHAADPRTQATPTDCVGCHRSDDEHRGGNGRACGDCHTNVDWARVRFDHGDTDFPLRGAHAQVRCESCHAGPPALVETDTACASCHETDDVHKGQQGRDCGLCHDSTSWRSARFDHEITRFPLLGLHAVASCEQCHTSQAFHDAETDCVSCHRADDAHGGSLGQDCATCHNPNDWRIWDFDHGVRTRFDLVGAHDGLACSSCHRGALQPEAMRSDCGACHERDDVHRGALGDDCGRCHGSDEWQKLEIQ